MRQQVCLKPANKHAVSLLYFKLLYFNFADLFLYNVETIVFKNVSIIIYIVNIFCWYYSVACTVANQ